MESEYAPAVPEAAEAHDVYTKAWRRDLGFNEAFQRPVELPRGPAAHSMGGLSTLQAELATQTVPVLLP